MALHFKGQFRKISEASILDAKYLVSKVLVSFRDETAGRRIRLHLSKVSQRDKERKSKKGGKCHEKHNPKRSLESRVR